MFLHKLNQRVILFFGRYRSVFGLFFDMEEETRLETCLLIWADLPASGSGHEFHELSIDVASHRTMIPLYQRRGQGPVAP
jgi:hypothetical protein